MNIVYFVFQDISGIKLQMGVSGKGVTIFCGEHPDFTPLNNFPWSVKSTVLYWGIIIIVMWIIMQGSHSWRELQRKAIAAGNGCPFSKYDREIGIGNLLIITSPKFNSKTSHHWQLILRTGVYAWLVYRLVHGVHSCLNNACYCTIYYSCHRTRTSLKSSCSPARPRGPARPCGSRVLSTTPSSGL